MTGLFQNAGTIGTETEDILTDSVDQSYQFQRTSFIPLTSAKIEQKDILAEQVPSPEVFCIQKIQEFCLKNS